MVMAPPGGATHTGQHSPEGGSCQGSRVEGQTLDPELTLRARSENGVTPHGENVAPLKVPSRVGFLGTPLVWFGIEFPGLEGPFPVDPISAASVSEEEKGPGLRPGRRDPSPPGHHPPLPIFG